MKRLLLFTLLCVGLQAQVSAPVWTQHSPGAGPPAFAGWNSIVRDSVSGQLLWYSLSNASTQGGIYSTDFNWVELANSTPQWLLQPGATAYTTDMASCAAATTIHQPKPRHPYSGFPIMDDARGIGILLGGSCSGGITDMVEFTRHNNINLNDGTFAVVSPGAGVYPNCIQYCGGVYDPDDDVYFAFGYNGGAGQSLWVYCNTQGYGGTAATGVLNTAQTAYGRCSTPDKWLNITPGTVPPNAGELGAGTLQNPSMVWNPFTHKIYLYGGTDATFSFYSNQLWNYTPSTNTFVELCGAGCTKPPVASPSSGIIVPMMDTNRGYIWIHLLNGTGCPCDGYYTPSTDRWHMYTSNGGETDTYTTTQYDPITDKFISAGQASGAFADVWVTTPIGGRSMRSGSGVPSSGTGNDGDLYYRTDSKAIYGPKIDGSWSSTFSYIIGVGCTTAYHIDKDCDGYGVGPTAQTVDYNPLFSVDADDNDVDVNTPASVITKWGSISAFLTHLSYPTSTITYIDPVSGSDSTGAGTVGNPYQTWTPVITNLSYAGSGAGATTLIYRGGITGLGNYLANSHLPYASSSANPIVIIPYPGERGILQSITADSQGYGQSSNVIYDGFTLHCGAIGTGNGFDGNHNDGIIIKNMEISGCSHGWQVGGGGQNLTIDGNVFHDTQSHAVYPTTLIYSATLFDCPGWTWNTTGAPFPSGYNPFKNLIFKNNLVYNSGTGGLEAVHLNALICGGSVTGNIIHNTGGTGLGFQTGVQGQSGSPFLIANNAIFSNQSSAITMSIYGCDNNGSASTSSQFIMGGSCFGSSFSSGTFYNPAFFNYISIINNTFWTGQYATQGGGQCSPTDPAAPGGQCQIPTYGINMLDYSVGTPDSKYLKNTVIQNNLILTYNTGSNGTNQFQFSTNSYPDTNTIKNNMFYNLAAGNSQNNLMFIGSDAHSASPGTYTFTQFQSYNTGSNSNNLFNDPGFTDVALGYYATPNLFNFHLASSGSPANGTGLTTNAPSTDIAGLTRPNPPSIGAYEFSAGTASANYSGFGGKITFGGKIGTH